MTSPVKEKTGKVGGSPVVARDVTSHKHGEAASRLSEKRVLVALKHAPVAVVTRDLQLRRTWVTPPVSAWDYRNLLGSTDAGNFGVWDNWRLLGITEAENPWRGTGRARDADAGASKDMIPRIWQEKPDARTSGQSGLIAKWELTRRNRLPVKFEQK